MTINELLDKYHFHDSTIEEITYDISNGKLEFIIDFCYWLQNGYSDGDKENCLVKLCFSSVDDYEWKTGVIDSFAILEIDIEDSTVKMNILDAFNNKFYEIQFTCKSVEFVECSN